MRVVPIYNAERSHCPSVRLSVDLMNQHCTEDLVPDHIYEVFARKTHDEELKHVGSVNASDDDLAKAYAWTVYDEDSWIEMCVVPRSAVIPVTEHGAMPLWGN